MKTIKSQTPVCVLFCLIFLGCVEAALVVDAADTTDTSSTSVQSAPEEQNTTVGREPVPAECQLTVDDKDRQRAWGVLAYTESQPQTTYSLGSAFVLSTSMMGSAPLDSAANRMQIARRKQYEIDEWKKAGVDVAPNATIDIPEILISGLEVATDNYVVFVTAAHVLASVLEHKSEGTPKLLLFHPTGAKISIKVFERQTYLIREADIAFIRVPTNELNGIPSIRAQHVMGIDEWNVRCKQTNCFDGAKVSNYGFPGTKMLAAGTQSATDKVMTGRWNEGPWKQSGVVISAARIDTPFPLPETGNKLPALMLNYYSIHGFSGGPVVEDATGEVIGVLIEGFAAGVLTTRGTSEATPTGNTTAAVLTPILQFLLPPSWNLNK